MRVAPLRDAVVDPVQMCVRPHEVREQPEQDAADDHDEEGKRQREAGRRGRVHSRPQRTA